MNDTGEVNRIERVLLIHHRLVETRQVSTGELATHFGVSRRTIQRDIAVIARLFPIYTDGRFWLYNEEEEIHISHY